MKKVPAAFLSVLALALSVCLLGRSTTAQQTPNSPSGAIQQQSMPSQGDQNAATELKTFVGKIVKLGDKLVLTDVTGKMTYQLDDQQKAQEFLNKNVKVTGTLDASTGVIRVSAIEPA